MNALEMSMARFAAALARLERGAARVAGRDDAIRVQASAIARLKRENEQLRAAQAEEARLRDETLAQVDRAMAAVEQALSGRGALASGSGAAESAERAADRDMEAAAAAKRLESAA